ncbi:MAG: hypothetical protein J6W46_09685, partial [Spirochaetaceae bacterium]|nr:hypothetical protein [Spirochaetaceae bacterium]
IGTDEFSRQAMIEPVDVAMDKNGRIFVGKITYKDGEPVASEPVEMTSQGAQVNGLDARKIISAGYAVHIYGGAQGGYNGGAGGAYIKPVYEQTDTASSPIVDITSKLTVGFRYLQFGNNTPTTVTANITALENLTVNVRVDDYKGKVIASFPLEKGDKFGKADLTSSVIGKHAIYFEFLSDSKNVIAEFDTFTFD